MSTDQHLQTGTLGEKIAERYLKNYDHTIVERNYRKPWGEIDIISKKEQIVHFIEVKTVSYETKSELQEAIKNGTFRPDEQVDHGKLKKLRKIIETWCSEKRYRGDLQLDVAAVRIVSSNKYAAVEYFPNVSP